MVRTTPRPICATEKEGGDSHHTAEKECGAVGGGSSPQRGGDGAQVG